MKQSFKKQVLRSGSRGFTILELLFVMVIMAILLALSTPSVKSMIDKQRVRGSCEAIYQNIALARSSAISINRAVNFQLVGGGSWCSGVSDSTSGGTCNCSTAAGEGFCKVNGIKRVASYTNFGGSTVTVTAGSATTSITFDARDASPTTAITEPNGDITVASTFWACKLRVEPLGTVRYKRTGIGTNSRTIVPVAEAAGLY